MNQSPFKFVITSVGLDRAFKTSFEDTFIEKIHPFVFFLSNCLNRRFGVRSPHESCSYQLETLELRDLC